MVVDQHLIQSEHRFFEGNQAALRCIGATLVDAEDVRIATAYFESSGFQALQDTLQGKRIRLLVGRQEGGEDNVRQVLEEFRHELACGPQERRTRAMRQMLEALQQGWLMVSVGAALSEEMPWLDARYLYHHAKLYIADEHAVVVTSANFSYHGLCRSREAGIVIAEPEDVAYFVHRFDEYFQQAQPITAALIDALRQWLQRRFAPIANEVLAEERNPKMEVQVLVATRAMAEGFNLQDAAILVNYDLPWTVLQLAQRMGRILRPWREPRDVVIYNFVPSTMGHERVRHARNWEQRLQERSRQHRSLAQIPVLVHQESHNQPQEFIMEKLGREMYLAHEDSAELDLGQVMEFIQSVDDLTTSRFYNDLAVVSNRDELLSLPFGIRSAMVKPGPKRLFLLLRRGRSHVYTVLADARGRHLDESLRREAVMNLIRCEPGAECAPFDVYPEPDDFDAWIERTRQNWAQHNEIDDPSRLQIVCAMALLPTGGSRKSAMS